jgi:hypothetical protein
MKALILLRTMLTRILGLVMAHVLLLGIPRAVAS